MSLPQARLQTRAERYIHKLLDEYGVIYNYRSGGFYTADKKRNRATPVPVDQLIARLYVDSDRFGGLGKDKISAVLMCVTSDAETKSLEQLRSQIIGYESIKQANCEEALKNWIDAVCQEGGELSYEIMRHWIWGVKRKIFSEAVSTPICPILRGLTQGGKTTATRLLTGPLKDYTRVADLKQIADDREWRTLLGRFYVVVLDEMARASKTNSETLKAVISAESLDPRILGLNMHSHIDVRSSFIGTTNKPLNQIIQDTTSAARYWELRCKDRLDWDVLNSINYHLIWGVAPHLEASNFDTMAGLRDKIQRLQHEDLRYKDPIEIWIEELGMMTKGDLIDSKGAEIDPHQWTMKFIASKKLYDHYKNYCQTFTYPPVNMSTFGNVLNGLKYESMRHRRKNGKQIRGFNIFLLKEIFEENFVLTDE